MTTQTKPLSIFGIIEDIGSETVGENYTKNDFLVKVDGQYPYEVYFICFGLTVEQLSRCKIGDAVQVHFSISSKKYKDKYFTELKAYKITIDFKANTDKGGNNG